MMEREENRGGLISKLAWIITPIAILVFVLLKRETLNEQIAFIAALFSVQLFVLSVYPDPQIMRKTSYLLGTIAIVIIVTLNLNGINW